MLEWEAWWAPENFILGDEIFANMFLELFTHKNPKGCRCIPRPEEKALEFRMFCTLD
jgi:hypothetical protein